MQKGGTVKAPSQNSPTEESRVKELVFGEAPHDTYLVFTTLERAKRIDGYRRALKAKTWGEFRTLIGKDVYAKLFQDSFDEENPEPKDREPFDPTWVPGFEEGDFPPWIVTEMERHVPIEILSRFGERRDSMLNGTYWHIDSRQRDEVLAALAEIGVSAVERKDLMFW